MHLENEDTARDPFKAKVSPRVTPAPSVNFQDPKKWESPTTPRATGTADEDKGYARGGNAIFGDPLVSVTFPMLFSFQDWNATTVDYTTTFPFGST